MPMKHRWIGIGVLAAALTLVGCAPTDQGADEDSAASATPAAEPSATATPYSMDDY